MAEHPRAAWLATISLVFSLVGARELCADPSAPAESNVDDEKSFRRDGFAIGITLGSGLLLGTGSADSVRGAAGAFGIRLGTSAGDDLLWFAQLDALSQRDGDAASVLTLGAHYYVRDAVWLRGGVGVANAVQHVANLAGEVERRTHSGLGLVTGAGVDVFRRGIFAVDLELTLSRSFLGQARMNAGSVQLAVNWY